MKYGLFSFIAVFFIGSLGFSQTLLVSDIDDTIKLANVQSFKDAITYSFDETSRFMGMSELYNLVVQDNPDMQVVYLSKAPTWLMQKRHLNLLKNGSFPEGTYIGRSEYSGDVHKLENLRKMMKDLRPKKVIMLGDNGEADPQVYRQIVSEFRDKGIEFYQFIRIVYSKTLTSPGGMMLSTEQTGFVTPVEVALELSRQGLMKASSVDILLRDKAADLANENLKEKNGEYAFPYFVECSAFRWKWDGSLADYPALGAIKKRIVKRCGLKL